MQEMASELFSSGGDVTEKLKRCAEIARKKQAECFSFFYRKPEVRKFYQEVAEQLSQLKL
jgi:hypothetical protein